MMPFFFGGGRGGGGGGGGNWVNVCLLCAAGLSEPLPIIVYFLANYRPHLRHFLENVISAIPTKSLSIDASTL